MDNVNCNDDDSDVNFKEEPNYEIYWTFSQDEEFEVELHERKNSFDHDNEASKFQ